MAAYFKTTISTRWKQTDQIKVLEHEAVWLSVRHMLKSPKTFSHRGNILIDRTIVVGTVTKGRSSVICLNSRLRRLAALKLSENLHVIPHWVPTDFNRADKPSRRPATMTDILTTSQLRSGIKGINIIGYNEKKKSRFISYRTDSLRLLE